MRIIVSTLIINYDNNFMYDKYTDDGIVILYFEK